MGKTTCGQGLLRVRTLEQWWTRGVMGKSRGGHWTRGVMGKSRGGQGVLWVRPEVDNGCYG
jgi:hypothetical protein